MSDLLQVSDLERAKLHDKFHSEVITGKVGGVSTGANIDYATNAVTAQVQKTLPKILDDLDWSYVGLFADGVTFTDKTDFAVDAVGTQWIYTGSLPFSATAGTVPSEPTYQVVHVKSASAISNANGGSVQDFIDAQYTNVAELATGKFQVGQYVRLTDRAMGLFLLQSGGTPDGYGILDAGNGNVGVYFCPSDTANVAHLGGGNGDATIDTGATQAAALLKTNVYFPSGKVYNLNATVNLAKFGQTLLSDGDYYSAALVRYSGSGAAFKAMATSNYITVKNIAIRGVPTTTTDFYNTGSVGIDITDGAVSVKISDAWLGNFETLVQSNYNSFYNSVSGCRLEKFRYGLNKMSANNLTVENNRITNFNTFATINGNNGPTSIHKNAFEVFNGPLVNSAGSEYPSVSFKNNYIEDYYPVDLPTNFPASSSPNTTKFGGDILFTGSGFGMLDIQDNDGQIASIFRIVSAVNVRHFVSKGNQWTFAQAGNNLDRLYSFGSTETEYVEIADVKAISGTVNAGFTRTYTQISLDTKDVNRFHSFYDCFTGTIRKRTTNLSALTLINGWTANDAANGSARAFKMDDGSTSLAGTIDGTSKTGEVFAIVPLTHRPYEYGSTRAFASFSVFSALGAGTVVRCRYIYPTGEIRMELGASSYVSLPLDGIVIPPRH